MSDSQIRATDVSKCDQEPVRYIAAIQEHAAFFNLSRGDFRIHNYSKNVEKILGEADVLHRRLNEFPFGALVQAQLEKKLRLEEWKIYKELYFKIPHEDRSFEVHVFDNEGFISCEIEAPHWVMTEFPNPELMSLRQASILSKFKASTDLKRLGKDLCQEIRMLTGLERVMLYQFAKPDWHGEVIAEDKVATAHSFLGHRFPASDIPKPARDLYLRNKVRYIADSSAKQSPVIPPLNSATGKTIDLSDSKTRGVSQVHLDYLINMGVKTSYSVAITVDNELWGLVACHSPSLVYVNQDQRLLCENLAEAFAMVVPLIETQKVSKSRLNFDTCFFHIFNELKGSKDPLDQLFRNYKDVLKLFASDGVAFVSSTKVDMAGFTPPRADLVEISQVINEEMDRAGRDILAVDSLTDLDKKWENLADLAAGALAVRVKNLSESLFILFRKEFVSTVIWGGDPRKLEARNYEGNINPRKSFESWQEVIRHRTAAWEAFEVEGIRLFRNFIFDTLIVNERILSELTTKYEEAIR